MIISAETFQAIIDSIRTDEPHKPRDKRAQPRVGFTGIANISLVGPGANPRPFPVHVRDLSTSGIGLLHQIALPIGQQFLLCLKSAANPDSDTPAILCTVTRHRRVDDGLFTIGARFTRELEDKIRNAVLS